MALRTSPARRLAALALVLALAVLPVGPAAADYTLTILHTNDVHSRIEPINAADSTCDAKDEAAGACFGGVCM